MLTYYPDVDYGRPLEEVIVGCEHFKYKECIASPSAMKLGIKNIPSEADWQRIELTAREVIQPIRNQFGPIKINSWFRSPQLNSSKLIGGSPTSNHCIGEAVDLVPVVNTVTKLEVLEWIVKNLTYYELIAEYFPQGWIHIAFRRGSDRRLLKLKDRYHNYSVVNIEYIKGIYRDRNITSN